MEDLETLEGALQSILFPTKESRKDALGRTEEKLEDS